MDQHQNIEPGKSEVIAIGFLCLGGSRKKVLITTMKKYIFFFAFLVSLAAAGFAQEPVRHKIAVFTPLYLDSAFTYSDNYAFNKTFPKFLNPGIEFYQGVQAALDSLQKREAPLEVFIYDSRSSTTPLSQQLKARELDSVEMIIAQTQSC